jgi:DNA repair protein RadC
MILKTLPKHLRPREKLVEKGPQNLKDKELLAILLRTGSEGRNVIQIADHILQKHPLTTLLSIRLTDLIKIKGVGPTKPPPSSPPLS